MRSIPVTLFWCIYEIGTCRLREDRFVDQSMEVIISITPWSEIEESADNQQTRVDEDRSKVTVTRWNIDEDIAENDTIDELKWYCDMSILAVLHHCNWKMLNLNEITFRCYV